MRVSYPAPRLVQFDDEEAILIVGEIVAPGFVERREGVNGLHLWVETDDTPNSRESRRAALTDFQLLLGILRTHWPGGGELFGEFLGGLGEGSARDADGNQWIGLAGARDRSGEFDDLRAFAERANVALRASRNLQCALILFGRADRNAADFQMIQEYVEREFVRFGANDVDGVYRKLGVAVDDQKIFKVNIHVLVADVLDRRRFGMSAGGLSGCAAVAALRWVRAVVAARGFR